MKTFLATFLISAAGVIGVNAHAQTYKWVDEKGRVTYSATPPPPGASAKKSQEINSNPAMESRDYSSPDSRWRAQQRDAEERYQTERAASDQRQAVQRQQRDQAEEARRTQAAKAARDQCERERRTNCASGGSDTINNGPPRGVIVIQPQPIQNAAPFPVSR
jgi:hypothetical protein